MLDQAQISFLKNNALFAGFSENDLVALAKNMSILNLAGGDYLMHEGDPASEMYLLFQGRLRVYGSKDKTKYTAEIGVGAVVGELALLTDMPRVADVRAVRDSTLIRINQSTFRSWVKLHPESAFKMISASIKRLLPSNSGHPEHPVTTLAIVPGVEGIDIKSVANALLEAMRPYKKCILLSEEDEHVREAIKHNQAVSIGYLNQCEEENELIIYLACDKNVPWTKQCFRQADKLLMVVPQTFSLPSESIQYLHADKNTLAEKYLLVLHPADKRMPRNTDVLMESAKAERVFHIKGKSDYQRLGRFFTGNAVSLVLSGGGLRGAAHIGLYYALQSKGIPVDMLGGSSFGALAAAVIGLNLPRSEIDLTSQWVKRTLPGLMDYTLPVVSILKGKKLDDLLIQVFTTKLLLEDLWIPTFCTATNMTDADIKIFDRGVAWETIRASISLPGIFPPIVKDGKILVDGATFNNLPVDIMRDRNNGGKVIASSVSTDLPHEKYFARQSSVSGFDVLADRFRAKPHSHMPSLFELLINAEFIGAQRHMNQVRCLSDYHFDLNVSEHPMLDLTHWDAIVDKGYQRGLRLIEDAGLSREKLGIMC